MNESITLMKQHDLPNTDDIYVYVRMENTPKIMKPLNLKLSSTPFECYILIKGGQIKTFTLHVDYFDC